MERKWIHGYTANTFNVTENNTHREDTYHNILYTSSQVRPGGLTLMNLFQNLDELLKVTTQDPKYAVDVCRAGIYFGTLFGRGYDFEGQERQIKIVQYVNGEGLGE